MNSILLLLGTLLLSQPTPSPPPIFCEVRILRDYDLSVTYFAVFRLSSSCPPGGVARVLASTSIRCRERKSRRPLG